MPIRTPSDMDNESKDYSEKTKLPLKRVVFAASVSECVVRAILMGVVKNKVSNIILQS